MDFLVAPVSALSFAFGAEVVLCGYGGYVFVYDTKTTHLMEQLEVLPTGCIHGLVVQPGTPPEGPCITAVFGQKHVAVVEISRQHSMDGVGHTFALTMLMDLGTRKDWVHCVAWLSPDGGAHSAGRRGCSRLAVGYAHNDMEMWDWEAPSLVARMRCLPLAVLYSMELWGSTAQDMLVAAGTIYNDVVLWRARDGHPVTKLTGHVGSIYKISINAVCNALVSASDDRSLMLWQTPDGAPFCSRDEFAQGDLCCVRLNGHSCRVWDCRALAATVVSCGEDNRCIVWDYIGRQVASYEHSGHGVWVLACSEASGVLATGGNDGSVKLWPLPALDPAKPQAARHKLPMDAYDTVRLPNVGSGTNIKCLTVGAMQEPGTMAPVYVGTGDGVVYRVTSPADVSVVMDRPGASAVPQQLCLSTDGALLFAGYSNGAGRMHRCAGAPATAPCHALYPNQPVFFAAFAAEPPADGGHWLFTSNALAEVTAWRVRVPDRGDIQIAAAARFGMRKARERVASVCLLRDAGLLVVGDVLGSVHVYDAAPLIAPGPAEPEPALQVLSNAHAAKAVRQLQALGAAPPGAGAAAWAVVSVGLDGAINTYAAARPCAAGAPPLAQTDSNARHAKDLGNLLAAYHAPAVAGAGGEGGAGAARCLLGARTAQLILWDVAANCKLKTFPCGPKRELVAGSFSAAPAAPLEPPGRLMYTVVWVNEFQLCVASSEAGAGARTARGLPAAVGRTLGVPYHGAEVYHVQWVACDPRDPDGACLLSASEDTTLSVLRPRPRAPGPQVLRGAHTSSVRCAAVLRDEGARDAIVFSAGGQEELCVWRVRLPTLCGALLSSCSVSRQYRQLFHPEAGHSAGETSDGSSDEEADAGEGRGGAADGRGRVDGAGAEGVGPRALDDGGDRGAGGPEGGCAGGRPSGGGAGREAPGGGGALRSWQVRQQRERRRVHYRVLCMALVRPGPAGGGGGGGGEHLVLGCSDAMLKVFRYCARTESLVPVAKSPGVRCGPVLSLGTYQAPDVVLAFSGTTTANLYAWDLTGLWGGAPGGAAQATGGLPDLPTPLADLPSHKSGVNAVATHALPGGMCLVASGGDDQSARATVVRVAGRRVQVLGTRLLEATHSAGLRSVQCDERFMYTAGSDQRVNVYEWAWDAGAATVRVTWFRAFLPHVQAVASLAVWPGPGDRRRIAVAGQGLQVLELVPEAGPPGSAQ